MKNQKIVFVGGGSCSTPARVKTVLEKKEIFEGSEICLFDTDSHYFPMLIKVCNEMCKKEKVDIKITSTCDIKEAFKNATFIYFVWHVGGEEVSKNDIAIPTSFNMVGDETEGIGGTFMAQRQIPVAINYCKMIENICPDAWIINLTNPTNLIADAVRRETNVKFIATCDCICGFATRWLPKVMNMPPFERYYHVSKDLWPRAIGVNHYTWLVKLMVNGKDGYPLLRKIIKESKEKIELMELKERVFSGLSSTDSFTRKDFPYNLFEAYDYVDVSSIHTQIYYEQNDYIERVKDYDKSVFSGLGWNKERELQIKKIIEGADYDPAPWGNVKDYSFDLADPRLLIGIMASIITNDGREWGGINFPNIGIITNLPQNSIVEGPAIINAMGSNPVPMGDLPKPFVGLTQQIINWAELAVDAALSGDKKILYQAILASPLVLDMRVAKEIMNKMLVANSRFLPQYKI